MKNRFLPVLLVLFALGFGQAQAQRQPNPYQKRKAPKAIDQSHWLLGLKGGVSFNQPLPTQRYEVLSPAYVEGIRDSAKVYNSLSENRGYHFGLTVSYFPISMLGITFEPTFAQYRYGYRFNAGWVQTETGSSLQTAFDHQQKASYIDVPIMLTVSPLQTPFKVYGQVGGYYGFRIKAEKMANSSETFFEAENQNTQTTQQKAYYADMTEQFEASHFGLLFGGGLSYDIENWRISLEGRYKMGLSPVINSSARYSQTETATALYDVPDDFKWNQVEVSTSVAIPLDNLVQSSYRKPPKKRK